MTAYTARQAAYRFRLFAEQCLPGSALYSYLSARIAEDADLLDLACATRAGQPPPNMLFGAVHYLLLGGTTHSLSAYYPTLGSTAPPGEPAFAAFRAFCLEQATTIRHLVATHITQTNETRRCAYLLPAFQVVANISGQDLSLLEIGPSAGLNMLWDRYHYDYNAFQVGNARSLVRITTELQGPTRPPIPDHPPAVAWRCGIEISPPDLGNADAVRWLEALIWPEKIERLTRLRAAIAMAQAAPPPIISGDALKLLPTFIAKAPNDTALCIYHTHVIYQFSPAMREQLDTILAIAGQTRPIYRLSCEGMDVEYPQLTLTINKGGISEEWLLARVSGHGDWVEWKTGVEC